MPWLRLAVVSGAKSQSAQAWPMYAVRNRSGGTLGVTSAFAPVTFAGSCSVVNLYVVQLRTRPWQRGLGMAMYNYAFERTKLRGTRSALTPLAAQRRR